MRRTRLGCFHGEQLPIAGDAFERVFSAVVELDAGSGDEILDCAGDEHFARRCDCCNACADVDGDPGDFLADSLALAGVQPRSHFESDLVELVTDGAGAVDRACGAVEGGEEAVAGRVDLMASEAAELASDRVVVALEQFALGAVAERGCLFARADDVGEER